MSGSYYFDKVISFILRTLDMDFEKFQHSFLISLVSFLMIMSVEAEARCRERWRRGRGLKFFRLIIICNLNVNNIC